MLPEVPYKVIYPNGEDRLIQYRKPSVIPATGEVHMRCGRCGSTDFTAHLKVGTLGAAKLTNLYCNVCAKKFPFNGKGETGGTLTMSKAEIRKREEINGRIDT